MNIIFTANSCYNLYNFRKNLITYLISQKYNIIILSNEDEYTKYLQNIGCKFFDLKMKSHSISFFNNFFLFIKVFYYIYHIKPKYIFSFTIKPNIFCALISIFFIFRFKLILTITGLGTVFTKNSFIYFIIRKIYFFSAFLSYHCFFHNNHITRCMLQNN